MQPRASSCQGGGFSYGTKVLGLGSAAAEAAALAAAAERRAAREAALAAQNKSHVEALRRSAAAWQDSQWLKAAPEGRALEARLCALVATGSDADSLTEELRTAATGGSGLFERKVCFRRLGLSDSKEAALQSFLQSGRNSGASDFLLEIYEEPLELVGGATLKVVERLGEGKAEGRLETFLVCESPVSPNAERLFEALDWRVRTRESVVQSCFQLKVGGGFVEARLSRRFLDDLRSKEVFPGRVLLELVAAEATDVSPNTQQRTEQRQRLNEQIALLHRRLQRAASAFDGMLQFAAPSELGVSA